MTLPQDIPPDIGKLQSEMNAAVKAHWKAFLFEGIVLALLGLAAMIVPPLASLAVTIFLGWMFLISGIAGLFATYWARQMPGFWWSLFSAALAVLAGGILLAKPEQGVLTLTIVIGAYFLAEGVVTIMYALEHRRELSERWSWLLISGVMDLLIAFIIVAGPAGFGGMGDRPSGRDQPRARRRVAGRHGARRAPILTPPIMGMTSPDRCAIEPAMIMIAANSFWYFSYDSSLAVGGSRSI